MHADATLHGVQTGFPLRPEQLSQQQQYRTNLVRLSSTGELNPHSTLNRPSSARITVRAQVPTTRDFSERVGQPIPVVLSLAFFRPRDLGTVSYRSAPRLSCQQVLQP